MDRHIHPTEEQCDDVEVLCLNCLKNPVDDNITPALFCKACFAEMTEDAS